MSRSRGSGRLKENRVPSTMVKGVGRAVRARSWRRAYHHCSRVRGSGGSWWVNHSHGWYSRSSTPPSKTFNVRASGGAPPDSRALRTASRSSARRIGGGAGITIGAS